MSDPLLTAQEEATLTGLSKGYISRARRHPTHPANSPAAVVQGQSVLVPEALVLAYWAARRAAPGPPASAPHRLAGVNRTQWAALCAVADGRVPSRVTAGRLVALGLIDGQGALTDAGRAKLAAGRPAGTLR
jgi:hypothetical protein